MDISVDNPPSSVEFRTDKTVGKHIPEIDRTIPTPDIHGISVAPRLWTQVGDTSRRQLTGLVATVLALGLLWTFASIPSGTAALTAHDPILIDGDDDFTEANGVTGGSGTEMDPFVMEGWDVTSSSGSGIEIRNTVAHVVIRSVHVHGPSESSPIDKGIYLYNVSHCSMENLTAGASRVGVQIEESDNVSLSGGDIYSCVTYAMQIQNSVDLTVDSVEFLATGFGIFATTMRNAEFLGCNFSSSSAVAYFDGVVNVLFEWLNASDCQFGLYLFDSSSMTIAYSSFLRVDYPIQMYGGQNFQVLNSQLEDSAATGIYASGADVFMIFGNTVSHSDFGGIILEQCTYTVIVNNTFSNNTITSGFTGAGVLLLSSTNVSVYHNSFINNLPGQAEDDMGIDNDWDDGYPSGGNFWLDYTGYDNYSGEFQDIEGSDGIGDTPYVIDLDSQDDYPLMEPIPEFDRVVIPVVAMIVIMAAIRASRNRK